MTALLLLLVADRRRILSGRIPLAFLENNQTRHDRRGRVETEEEEEDEEEVEEDAQRRAHDKRKTPRQARERTRGGLEACVFMRLWIFLLG